MNELAKHIANLLLENDCVIIPNFGGFIAHYNPAQMVEEEHLFLPPMRVLGFNPQLRINDGLLAQSYMSVYGTTFPDAVKMIQQQAKELTVSLYETGSMELENVGELHFNIHGKYEFTPFDNRISTPGFYGLDTFKMQELKDLQAKQEETEQPIVTKTVTAKPKEEKGATITSIKPEVSEKKPVIEEKPSFVDKPSVEEKPSVNEKSSVVEKPSVVEEHISERQSETKFKKALVMSFNKYIPQMAAVAAIVLFIVGFFLISSPYEDTGINNTEASVLPKEVLKESLNMSSIVTHQAEVNAQTTESQAEIKENPIETTQIEATPAATPIQVSAPTPTPAPSPALTPAPSPTSTQKLYNVIVASVGNPEAAQKAAEDLVKQGYSKAKAIIGDGKARVSVESYEKEADAYRAIQQFQAKGLFEAAWVLRK